MTTLQIVGVVLAILGAALFFGGRHLTRKTVYSEVMRKVLHPNSEKPRKTKLTRIVSGVMVFLGGVLTSAGGYLLLGHLFK